MAHIKNVGVTNGCSVFACDAPVVVDSENHDYTSLRKLPNEEFFSDAFTFVPKD